MHIQQGKQHCVSQHAGVVHNHLRVLDVGVAARNLLARLRQAILYNSLDKHAMVSIPSNNGTITPLRGLHARTLTKAKQTPVQRESALPLCGPLCGTCGLPSHDAGLEHEHQTIALTERTDQMQTPNQKRVRPAPIT
jgi:hypothetical protein